ncbi:MAG: putative M18 family aminopeptidase 2 [Chlamydiae bacterium]|nr:putative M18 family aminopeptidase 2 [Chlamydiota bacterium]
MIHLLEDFCDFLTDSPTSYHAALEISERLASLDYTPLVMDKPWKLEKEKKYFVMLEGSIASFILPKKKPTQMSIIGSHTDSPALKLKPHPEFHKSNMQLVGVEVYGGPILPTWFNRDLAIAGQVIVTNKKGEKEKHLVFLSDTPLLIPLLAPHLDREAYKKGLVFNKQDHLAPIASLKEEKLDTPYLEELLRREITFEKLLDFDLFLVPIDPPRYLGKDHEMLASYRLDNLTSVHAALAAFGHYKDPPTHTLPLGLFWDHEEVGSSTRIGAASPFFEDIYRRIVSFYGLSQEEETIARHKSLCLSVDVTHALNPNYEKKYDPNHSPLLGGGVTVKYNANQRYSTSGFGAACVAQLCDQLDLKLQKFANRSDNPAGSTVGPLFATKLGIETVDIGLAQLSMHATREVIACQDQIDLTALLTYFLLREEK